MSRDFLRAIAFIYAQDVQGVMDFGCSVTIKAVTVKFSASLHETCVFNWNRDRDPFSFASEKRTRCFHFGIIFVPQSESSLAR